MPFRPVARAPGFARVAGETNDPGPGPPGHRSTHVGPAAAALLEDGPRKTVGQIVPSIDGLPDGPCVAQSVMLKRVCYRAGFRPEQLLSADSPPPAAGGRMFALATDDMCAFTCGGQQVAEDQARQIDAALEQAGVERNTSKDLTAVRNGTCVGIDLGEGRFLVPNASKQLHLLSAIAFLCGADGAVHGTPDQLSALCGSASWFCRLDRMLYSVFDAVYAFAHSADSAKRAVPERCRHEFWHFGILCVFLRVDLRTPWLNKVVATDASPIYGFGASYAPMDSSIRQRLLAAEGGPEPLCVTPA